MGRISFDGRSRNHLTDPHEMGEGKCSFDARSWDHPSHPQMEKVGVKQISFSQFPRAPKWTSIYRQVKNLPA